MRSPDPQHKEKLPPPYSLLDEIIANQPEDLFNKELEHYISQSDRLAAIGRLTVALVHDINSPLQIILGYLDLILDFSTEESERIQYLNTIRDEIKRLSFLTDHIVNYAQPGSITASHVSLPEVLQRTLLLTKKILEEKAIKVDMQVNDDVPGVIAVAEELEQVFLNLIINAYEATPKFGKLNITIESVNQNVLISFENSGKPIPEELMVCIFEPFFSTKSGNGGLGLWISRYLIESRGGTLTVANNADETGVTFTVILSQIVESGV